MSGVNAHPRPRHKGTPTATCMPIPTHAPQARPAVPTHSPPLCPHAPARARTDTPPHRRAWATRGLKPVGAWSCTALGLVHTRSGSRAALGPLRPLLQWLWVSWWGRPLPEGLVPPPLSPSPHPPGRSDRWAPTCLQTGWTTAGRPAWTFSFVPPSSGTRGMWPCPRGGLLILPASSSTPLSSLWGCSTREGPFGGHLFLQCLRCT